jgi:hypothetical protein
VVPETASTGVVDDNPVKVLTPLTSLPQAELDSNMRIVFCDAKPTPASSIEQASVKVQSAVLKTGPDIWNWPKSKV